MSNITTDRKVDGLGHDPLARRFRLPVAAATLLYSGALIMGNALGYAANAVEGAGNGDLVVHGIACRRVDNSAGAAGDLSVDVERTIADFTNGTGTNAITIADVGRMAYAIDNQTLSRHNGGNTRPCVGRIHSITATGRIMVEVGSHAASPGTPGGGDLVLTAGADLSAAQYHFVKLDGSGDVVLCSAAGEEPLGVLQNAPEATEPAIVRYDGVTQLVGSTNLAVGARVATTNAGRAKAVVTGRTDTDAGATNDPLVGSHAAAILLGAISGDGVAAKALLRLSGAVPQTAS
ncbi:MAG: hypothetical protein Q8S73_43005 [Deltaproteobacteria bacterium]|nr:hypothetical protein [Myxococcales bacterium]MDP3220932.1 hypothetical protein [Deltaproteobacteria bacterium]